MSSRRSAQIAARDRPLAAAIKRDELKPPTTHQAADRALNAADTLICDKATNTFLVKGADGAPRTMFRPSDGIDYWNKQ